MDYQSLHNKTVVELRKLARDEGIRVPAGTNKQALIALLMDAEQARQPAPAQRTAGEKAEPAGKAPAEERRFGRFPTGTARAFRGQPRRGGKS